MGGDLGNGARYAEALAPTVVVICGRGPITRVEGARGTPSPPPTLVDAALAAMGV